MEIRNSRAPRAQCSAMADHTHGRLTSRACDIASAETGVCPPAVTTRPNRSDVTSTGTRRTSTSVTGCRNMLQNAFCKGSYQRGDNQGRIEGLSHTVECFCLSCAPAQPLPLLAEFSLITSSPMTAWHPTRARRLRGPVLQIEG